jgi:16S rRNA (cytidine1402-2'-O)-methyltransferase
MGRTLRDLAPHLGSRRVAVCRELTKVHEEVVRGGAAELGGRFDATRGELTVVIERGQTTENNRPDRPADARIVSDFGEMTYVGGSRRARIAALARHHGLPTRDVYAILERAKGKTQEQ